MRLTLFYLCGALAVLFALAAVTRRKPVHAALWLVASLVATSGVYVALGAYFLAMAQVLVYAGAILMLFLFVIMMVGATPDARPERPRTHWWVGAGAAALFLGALLRKTPYPDVRLLPRGVDADALAALLVGTGGAFGRHALAFELASLLLLAAVVAAIALMRRRRD